MNHYPSLLLVTSLHEADWYEVQENKLKHLKKHDDPKETWSDREGHFKTRVNKPGANNNDVMKSGSPDSINHEREHEKEKHINNVAKDTHNLWKSEYRHLTIVAPSEIKNELLKKIKDSLPNKADIKFMEGNFTHHPNEKLLELFKESLKAFRE